MSISRKGSRSATRLSFDGTFDIECSDWTIFCVAATCTAPHDSRLHRSLAELVDYLLTVGGTWWAHCGGTYDFLAVLDECERRGLEIVTSPPSGSRISRFQCGRLICCDSYCLAPLALDVAAPIAGLVAPELDLPCRCGRGCAGYCRIGEPAVQGRVDDYCRADARTLLLVLRALQAHADDEGYTLRGTIGGTAWATAQRALDLPKAEFPATVWRRLRSAYVGGRVTVFRPEADGPGAHVDIASAYPAALAVTAVPTGAPRGYGARDAALCLGRSRPGVYSVTIRIPPSHVPPLPWRHEGVLAYPHGMITGAWPLPELEAALARGCAIVKVHWAVVWPTSEVLFGDLMRAWFATRTRVGKESPLGQWQGLLGRALTGKLAESPERRTLRLNPREITICVGERPCARERCSGACGAWQQIDVWGRIWSAPFYRLGDSAHLHWAAYLTAATRVQWLEGAEACSTDAVYGDTDSIWTQGRALPAPIGHALGSWAYKHGWRDWYCTGPKSYRYTDDAGAAHVRVAGAHLTDEEFRLGAAERDQGVMPFLSAAAASRGLFRRKFDRWTLPGRELRDSDGQRWYGDRVLDTATGITLPVTDGEIREKAISRAARKHARVPTSRAREGKGAELRRRGVAR